MAWYPPHKNRNRIGDGGIASKQIFNPLHTMGGCLRTSARKTTDGGDSYWNWSGSWEDLGIPAGATVTEVVADYIWRVVLFGRKASRDSTVKYGPDEVQSGKFEFWDDASFIDNFSEADSAPSNSGGEYRMWPDAMGDHEVSPTMAGWRQVAGSAIAVPGPQQASNSSIQFRLHSKLPSLKDELNNWIRIKQDYIVVTMTYTPASAGVGGWFF